MCLFFSAFVLYILVIGLFLIHYIVVFATFFSATCAVYSLALFRYPIFTPALFHTYQRCAHIHYKVLSLLFLLNRALCFKVC